MKIIFFALLVIASTGISGQNFEKLDDMLVDTSQMEFSKRFANDYFSKQVLGNYYQFNNHEATDEIVNLLTAEKQRQAYVQVKSGFGEFKSLEYAQTWTESNAKLIIYRFTGIFGDRNKLEIRVVLNHQGKIAGFFIKPWTENL